MTLYQEYRINIEEIAKQVTGDSPQMEKVGSKIRQLLLNLIQDAVSLSNDERNVITFQIDCLNRLVVSVETELLREQYGVT